MIGYALVSSDEQDLEAQMRAFDTIGCAKVYVDGGGFEQDKQLPSLISEFGDLHPGDTLVVYRLDSLARSLAELITLIDDLETKGINFRSLNENIDTTSLEAKLIFRLLAGYATPNDFS